MEGHENNLGMLGKLLRDTQERYLEVHLPKFTMASGFSAITPLKTMGIKDAFTTNANFTGISDTAVRWPLFMTHMQQRAWMSVDEKGTTIAVETAVVMGEDLSAPEQPEPFFIDHPFMFVIHAPRSAIILYMALPGFPCEY